MQISELVSAQRKYFASGITLPVSFRMDMLRRLYAAVDSHEAELGEALRMDLGKSATESFMCETGLVRSEISYLLRHIRRLARERRVATPAAQLFSRCTVRPCPLGSVLIMSPWNYPVLLTLEPLADSIAAGNTAILKPSSQSPHVSAVLEKLIGSAFPPEYAAVVTGGHEENRELLSRHFDLIFFTGSQAVGRTVMRAAAEHLTPVVLELGGKSPCIVDETADIPLSARRIVFGKYLNCGQTCVAPDYILCDRRVHDRLLEALTAEIRRQLGTAPLEEADLGRIVSEKHFDRLTGLLGCGRIVCGGGSRREDLKLEPTVLDGVEWSDPVMGEEIFGPILPVLTYDDFSALPELLEEKQKPLALYIFSRSREHIRLLKERCRYGGGCINDVVIHLSVPGLGFGGVGESGMGSYHGREGFRTFSHEKSIVDKKLFLDLPMRYRPYKKGTLGLLRRFLR